MKNRKNTCLALFLSLLIGAVSFAPYTCASDGGLEDQEKPNLHPSLSPTSNAGKDLADKLLQEGYLVHIAPLNPFEHDLILKAGSAIPIYMQLPFHNSKKPVSYKPNPDSFRPCLSFSINGVIGDHGEINISNRTYAVLIPLRNLASRITNLYPADTAVWGEIDIKEQEESIVFTPKEHLAKDLKRLKTGSNKATAQAYSGKLADAVETFLTEKTGFSVNFEDAKEGLEIFYDKALVKGVNLNVPGLFDSFLSTHPYASFGHESSSQKSGLTHWVRFLNKFNDDFLRIFKVGVYKEHPAGDLGLMRKYQVGPLLALAEQSISAVKDLLIASHREEILKDFETHHLPKLNRALANVKNYHKANETKPAYQNRIINYSDTLVVLENSPYTWVATALNTPAFKDTKKVFEVMYWFNRYISHHCHGHVKVDENDEFAMLQKSFQELKEKFETEGYDWSYVRFCNTIAGRLVGIPQTKENLDYIQEAMAVVMPLFPRAGSLQVQGPGQGEGSMDLKMFLEGKNIKFPASLWAKGITKKLPIFQSKNPIDESF
jgi:hypothetical protein